MLPRAQSPLQHIVVENRTADHASHGRGHKAVSTCVLTDVYNQWARDKRWRGQARLREVLCVVSCIDEVNEVLHSLCLGKACERMTRGPRLSRHGIRCNLRPLLIMNLLPLLTPRNTCCSNLPSTSTSEQRQAMCEGAGTWGGAQHGRRISLDTSRLRAGSYLRDTSQSLGLQESPA